MDFRGQLGSNTVKKLKKKVIFGVLDWGLGHASRSIPLIDSLIERDVEVVIASSGLALEMLKRQYADIQFVELPSYRIRFGKGNSIVAPVLLQLLRIQSIISKEHQILQKFIAKHPVDGVISDNRYGLWASGVPTVFMIHQVFLKLPGFTRFVEPVVNQLHQLYIKRFDLCWIPDYPGSENLSGELSHKKPVPFPHEFIGPLSRFWNSGTESSDFRYKAVAILSGPEPQRSILEDILCHQMVASDGQFALVRGLPGNTDEPRKIPNVDVFNYLEDKQLASIISLSPVVICRSGYSSLMDMEALGRPAILVPTPGQSEQEYLADYHSRNSRFFASAQKSFDLKSLIERVSVLPVIKNCSSTDIRTRAVDSFIGKL